MDEKEGKRISRWAMIISLVVIGAAMIALEYIITWVKGG